MVVVGKVQLKSGRDKPVRQRHPWVFSGAISREPGPGFAAGEIVEVVDSSGQFLGWGTYSAHSQIRVRILSWNSDETVDAAFIAGKVMAAVKRRARALADRQTNAVRLIFSESDGLPGVIVDKYGSLLVLQLLTAGADRFRNDVVQALLDATPDVTGIFERSDDHSRELEGMPKVVGTLFGNVPESGRVEILENGLKFLIDVRHGHKTGFYIDQRDSRNFIRSQVCGLRVFNGFCYTGGFSIACAAGLATEVISVDSSEPSLKLAKENAEVNGFESSALKWVEGDVFEALRNHKHERDFFDVVILDPPKFAHNTGQLNRATRGYKDLIMNGLQVLRPGGRLAVFSCSGLVGDDLFQKVAFGAALDAGVSTQVIGKFTQSGDHPILLTFPESSYLKGLWLLRD